MFSKRKVGVALIPLVFLVIGFLLPSYTLFQRISSQAAFKQYEQPCKNKAVFCPCQNSIKPALYNKRPSQQHLTTYSLVDLEQVYFFTHSKQCPIVRQSAFAKEYLRLNVLSSVSHPPTV